MSKVITIKKLNNEKVEPIALPAEATGHFLGENIIPEIYANIFLCAKKKSGKTCTIFKILKDCAGKETKIIVFCGSIAKDSNWIAMKKYFEEEKKMKFESHNSLVDDHGVDLLEELVETLKFKADQEEEEKKNKKMLREIKKNAPPQKHFIHMGAEDDGLDYDMQDEKKPTKKSKIRSPEYIIVLDDLSGQLKSRSLVKLLQANRHFKMKIIVSSQHYKDLLPASRRNADIFILFQALPEKILEEIYKDATLDIDFELFEKLYNIATAEKYNFLMIDTTNDQFRRNFSDLLDVGKVEESLKKNKKSQPTLEEEENGFPTK